MATRSFLPREEILYFLHVFFSFLFFSFLSFFYSLRLQAAEKGVSGWVVPAVATSLCLPTPAEDLTAQTAPTTATTTAAAAAAGVSSVLLDDRAVARATQVSCYFFLSWLYFADIISKSHTHNIFF